MGWPLAVLQEQTGRGQSKSSEAGKSSVYSRNRKKAQGTWVGNKRKTSEMKFQTYTDYEEQCRPYKEFRSFQKAMKSDMT